MKKMIQIFMIAMTTLCSLTVHAEIKYPIAHPKERFLKYIERLKPYVLEASKIRNPEEQIQYFNNSGIRSDLNYLQNLIDLYDGKKRFGELKPFFKSAKGLEDHISHYVDLQGFIYTARNGSPANAKKYADLFEQEKVSYLKFLAESGWTKIENSELDQLKAALDKVDWFNVEKDRNFLLTQFAKTMKKQHSEVYDMKDYELGMHEFRRDARRISYMNSGVGHLVESSYDRACPLGKPIVEDTAEPRPQERYTCQISSCLMDYLSQIQSDISNYKYSAQEQTLRGEEVSEKTVAGANEVVRKTQESKVYLYLENQLLGCRTQNAKDDK